MIKITLFGYRITIEKEGEKQRKAVKTKVDTSRKKIEEALEKMEAKQVNFSEYALQKESGLSINTIKKYRDFISEKRGQQKELFS